MFNAMTPVNSFVSGTKLDIQKSDFITIQYFIEIYSLLHFTFVIIRRLHLFFETHPFDQYCLVQIYQKVTVQI